MRTIVHLIVFSVSLYTATVAQDNLPPAFEITSDSALYTVLPETHWQMAEEKNGRLSFEKITGEPAAIDFHYFRPEAVQPRKTYNGYWFRYILKNTMDQDVSICLGDTLLADYPFFLSQNDESDFYCIDPGGKVTHYVNGFLVPWSKLNGIKEQRLIPVTLKRGEQLFVYRRIYSSYKYFPVPGDQFLVGFSSTKLMREQIHSGVQKNYFLFLQDSFIAGVLIFAAIFILFFFTIVQEKVYLFFSLYLFSLAIGRLCIYGEMYNVFFRESPVLYMWLNKFIWVFPLFFLIQFIRYLLNTKYHLSKWNLFLKVISLFYLASHLLIAFFDFTSSKRDFLGVLIYYESILLALTIPMSFFLSHKWYRSNKVLTYLVLPLQSIWSIFFILFSIRNILHVQFSHWISQNWHLLELILLSGLVISFSWILLHRFVDLRKRIAEQELEKEVEKSRLIELQKVELEQQVNLRTAELKRSLENLRATQTQLIQSEKMASLGELTAGIAHEIQNPLNFVNNFSEVSGELMEELKFYLSGGNYKNAEVIAEDVRQNLGKINHHGKRADAIVKGMLQHSQKTTGQQELTDVNALVDEYLKLAFHAYRGKDNSFDVNLATGYDPGAGYIKLAPHEIGRVLLNLLNNSFYAVTEKKKSFAGNGYIPKVEVLTRNTGSEIEITVRDNGNGVPRKIVDKIFQPFFTTKPTGQGTGLGLSLSYDIVKAHGGDISLETKEGEGSAFTILLPLNKKE